ncbi:Gem-associated protein 5 [Lunasporangiospora selenospora]|uniref:Gem-associated protein 5 n=1 Tax=Lunasporangiospora selenospora TaxID=979761 RepID=A0A9P6KE34_9FUNG|nr:Gem-associated protein 5 [Lunasporangiospora selenospora]
MATRIIEDTSFPPSPQWYQPHSASLCVKSESEGWLLYTLNNSIHIMNPFSLRYVAVLQGGHTTRINAIATRAGLSTTAQSNNTAADIIRDSDNGTNHQELQHHQHTHWGIDGPSDNGAGPDARLQGASVGNETVVSATTTGSLPRKSFSDKALAASGSEDGKVVCWDIVSRQVVSSLSDIHTKAVKAVEWTGDGQLIVSGDSRGAVVVWDPFEGKHYKKEPMARSQISCISSSPWSQETMAIGYEKGEILLCTVSLSNINIVHRLLGHSNKIHSLSWRPSTESNSEKMLASGSADQTIRVWHVDTDEPARVLRLPEDRGLGRYHPSLWIPVGWVNAGQDLISFTTRGTGIRWPMNPWTGKYIKMPDGHRHSRAVFQVLVWTRGNFAFTISSDRKLIAWDLDADQGVTKIECIGGNVNALSISPVDPGRIAMGLANESVKAWNTLSVNEPYESTIVENLQGKVLSVEWHPTEPGILCFGLENGSTGILNNMNRTIMIQDTFKKAHGKHSKQRPTQTLFPSHHESNAHSVAWCSSKVFEAPVPELFDLALDDSMFCVVSCGGDGKILIANSSRPTRKSLDIECVIQRQNPAWYQSYQLIKGIGAPHRQDFAIHPNEDLLAIGNSDGSVEVFELKYFRLVYVYKGHRQRVNRLKWSCCAGSIHGATADASPASYLLASGADDGSIAIHKLDQFSSTVLTSTFIGNLSPKEPVEDNEGQSSVSVPPASHPYAPSFSSHNIVPTTTVFTSFKNHQKGINSLSWCPHRHESDNEQDIPELCWLVASSFGGNAVVYQLQLSIVDRGSNHITRSQDCMDNTKDISVVELATVDDSNKRLKGRHRPIARFPQHEGGAMSVHWSLTDKTRIYSGGRDWRVCCWDWKDYELTEQEFSAMKKKPGGSKAAVANTSPSNEKRPPQDTTTQQAYGPEPSAQNDNPLSLLSSPLRGGVESRSSIAGSTEKEASKTASIQDQSVEQEKRVDVSPSLGTKRPGSSASTPAKRSRTNTSSTNAAPNQTSTRNINLFPRSSASFQVASKQKVHLEIVRLARNLFCRRNRRNIHSFTGIDVLETSRERWKIMLEFFKHDGELDGIEISQVLEAEMDELNFGEEEEDDEDDQRVQPQSPDERTVDSSKVPRSISPTLGSWSSGGEDHMTSPPLSTSESEPADKEAESELLAFDGDLVFYGSRESVKTLAEMEAQAMAGALSGNGAASMIGGATQGPIFSVGSGLGVFEPLSRESNSATSQQLAQVPVLCWMGDTPKIMEILGSQIASEVNVQDWIALALSPLGGIKAWRKMMTQTAAKFEAKGEIHAAVLCYLGAGQVFNAVDAYRKREYFREALMLLRIRMWDDEEDECDEENTDKDRQGDAGIKKPDQPKKDLATLHGQVLAEWGSKLERKGFYEQACKCQLALASLSAEGQTRVAASVGLQTLARRGDVATLRTVAGLAILLAEDSSQQKEREREYTVALKGKQEADSARRRQAVEPTEGN